MKYYVWGLVWLLLIIMSAPGSAPAASQVFQTTFTNVVNVSTSYATSTITQNETLPSGPSPIYIKAIHCWAEQIAITANKGDIVYAEMTSNQTVTLMVISDLNHIKWVSAGYPCEDDGSLQAYGPLVLKLDVFASVDRFTIPSDGNYYFIIFNQGVGKVAKVNLNVQATVAVTVIVPFPIKSTSSYTIVPTTSVLKVGLMPLSNFGMIGIVAIVAVIASVLVVAKREKNVSRGNRVYDPASSSLFQKTTLSSQPLISTGYADLDGTLQGGVPEGFSVVIVSPSYDERDLLLRKIIESAISCGRPAFYISNDMGRTQDLIRRYQTGFHAFSSQADKIPGHPSNLHKIPGIENLSDANISLALAIKEARLKEKATNAVMVIDTLSDILLRHRAITTRRWLSDFVAKRKVEGFTAIATLNPLATATEENQTIIDCFDGVIEIYEKALLERTRRFLLVKKMYGRRYSENELLLDKDKLF